MIKLKNFDKKRIKIYFGFALLALAIIAVLGYTLEGKKVPIRVAFETKGGGIIFDHKLHVNLKDSKCQECHHNYEPEKKDLSAMNCRKCHYSKEFLELCKEEIIHKRCIGKNCMDCHVKGSVDCGFCHNADKFIKITEPKEIEFDTDGGLVVFDHFKHSSPDEYAQDCEKCHHKLENKNPYSMNCRRCHYNKKYEKICENEDTHVRCIGKNCMNCHSDDAENCEKCHKE